MRSNLLKIVKGKAAFDEREWIEVVEQLRDVMGTKPSRHPRLETNFYRGVENIVVKMVDWPNNPYRAIFSIVTATWGDSKIETVDKWEKTSPEGRLLTVLAALKGETLPHCLEAPSFTFVISGPTRASFDQFARQRLGAAFGARGSRDNNWLDASFRIPEGIYRLGDEYVEEVKNLLLKSKEVYAKIVETGQGNWQIARTVLSQHVVYKWAASYNYAALRNLAATRLPFCEQEDTVATAWLIWQEMWKKFPLLAVFMRPKCDWAGKCLYHKAYSLSEMFGCLFAPCGRHPHPRYKYAEFNEACTDAATLEKQLGIKIPRPGDWDKLLDEAIERDFKYFEQE